MVEIKIATPLLTYRFKREGTKEMMTKFFNKLDENKQGYCDYGDENTLIPYNVLKNSVIEIYTIKNN